MTRKRFLAAALAWLAATVGAHAQPAAKAHPIDIEALMRRYTGDLTSSGPALHTKPPYETGINWGI